MSDNGRILIVYGTRYGQTAKIAEWMGRALRERGYVVTVADAASVPHDLSVQQADGVIVGGSVIVGRHQASVRRFISQHLAELRDRPSGFFSVSGSAGSAIESVRAEARVAVDRLLASLGWRPTRIAMIGGAMAYSRYGPVLRWVMRRIARKKGESDTDRDHEYTDWHQVAQFAESIATAVAERRGVGRRTAADPTPNLGMDPRATAGR
jgi:menaquinone-dependent protoporphyrinogen oxidase